jgi:nitrile hydratase accessory protein
MSRLADRIAVDIDGPAAIPRRNGEPVFNEPWESRVFGVAVALCERGLYEWDEFRERLIADISAADQRGDASTYYERFLAALERLMLDKGICLREEIDRRAATESADDDPDH